MNRGDLRDLVLLWVDDVNAGYFTEPEVNTYLNNAQFEVQKQLLQSGEYWYLKCATTYTVQNVGCYALPADFLKCNRLELRLSGTQTPNENWVTLVSETLNEAAFLNYSTGRPAVYTIGKDCLYLKQIPDNAYMIRLFYSYRVDEMTDDLNVPDVPTQYQEYLAVLAAIDCFLRDQRDPQPFLIKKQYYMDLMKQDLIQRNRAQPRRVVRTRDENWGNY